MCTTVNSATEYDLILRSAFLSCVHFGFRFLIGNFVFFLFNFLFFTTKIFVSSLFSFRFVLFLSRFSVGSIAHSFSITDTQTFVDDVVVVVALRFWVIVHIVYVRLNVFPSAKTKKKKKIVKIEYISIGTWSVICSVFRLVGFDSVRKKIFRKQVTHTLPNRKINENSHRIDHQVIRVLLKKCHREFRGEHKT